MLRIFRSAGVLSIACASAVASTGCNMDVRNPTVIDAATFNINADFFAPLSLAIASNENAIGALQTGPGAATDLNLARASMNMGFALELMAETACAGVIQGGPQLSDAQLLDSAITRFTNAVTVATAA